VRVPSADPGDGARLWGSIERAARAVPNLELLPPHPRSELLALMGRAVAVVSTSESEGMPNIFLEAWSRGIPALALDHDPDGIISRYGLGGFANGRPECLVELARELWDGRTERGEFGARSQAYVRGNHSAEAVSAEWASALRFTGGSTTQPFVAEVG